MPDPGLPVICVVHPESDTARVRCAQEFESKHATRMAARTPDRLAVLSLEFVMYPNIVLHRTHIHQLVKKRNCDEIRDTNRSDTCLHH